MPSLFPARKSPAGRPKITGDPAELASLPRVSKDITDFWLIQRKQRKAFNSRFFFLDLDQLLDPEVQEESRRLSRHGLTNQEVYDKHGREGLRRRFFMTRASDHPRVQLATQLARQYDRFVEDENWREALNVLKLLQKEIDVSEKEFAHTYEQQLKFVTSMARLVCKHGDPNEDTKDAEVVTPGSTLAELRAAGLSEEECERIMGGDYRSGVDELEKSLGEA